MQCFASKHKLSFFNPYLLFFTGKIQVVKIDGMAQTSFKKGRLSRTPPWLACIRLNHKKFLLF